MTTASRLLSLSASLALTANASAQVIDDFVLPFACIQILPPIPVQCLDGFQVILDPPAQFSVVSQITSEEVLRTEIISALCDPAIPCDLVNPDAGWSYTETTEKSYEVALGLELTTAASFAIFLLGEVNVEAGFYISGTRSHTGGTSETISVNGVVADCTDQIFNVLMTTSTVEGISRQPAVSVDWSTVPACGITPPVVRVECFVEEFTGTASRVSGHRLETDLQPCCLTPDCCGRLCPE